MGSIVGTAFFGPIGGIVGGTIGGVVGGGVNEGVRSIRNSITGQGGSSSWGNTIADLSREFQANLKTLRELKSARLAGQMSADEYFEKAQAIIASVAPRMAYYTSQGSAFASALNPTWQAYLGEGLVEAQGGKWVAKRYAKGGMIDEPSLIIGKSGNMAIAGEAGPESVVPMNGRSFGGEGMVLNITFNVTGSFLEGDPIMWQKMTRERIVPELMRWAASSPTGAFLRRRGAPL